MARGAAGLPITQTTTLPSSRRRAKVTESTESEYLSGSGAIFCYVRGTAQPANIDAAQASTMIRREREDAQWLMAAMIHGSCVGKGSGLAGTRGISLGAAP